MKLVYLTYIILILSVQCTNTQNRNKKKKIHKQQQAIYVNSLCRDKNCCADNDKCKLTCNEVFLDSSPTIIRKCNGLNYKAVQKLQALYLSLKTPIIEDLERLDLTTDFRLLLNIDFTVWVKIIKNATIEESKDILIWFVTNRDVIQELLRIPESEQNIILYELLASIGNRELPNSAEEGLITKISFNYNLFQYILQENNNELLQITHQMIKNTLCSSEYEGEGSKELCVLRVYCRERKDESDQYVHSTELRKSLSIRIQDKTFFSYIEKDILAGYNKSVFKKPEISDYVCLSACNSNSLRGCDTLAE